METYGNNEFLKAIADDIEQIVKDMVGDKQDYRSSLIYAEEQLRKIISDIRDYTSTKVTTIAGTTVISTTTDESK